ncbi:hypothetical protein BDB00DRAFT_868895 [Zychaea mexicana]|uniref:uncharacterized protein n=1 Tax=Zychaea mexicana TaxID=64656 RepID=UPI0022FEE010|nr:uncharacterized protein BDB00DRAFT_868895 [Zychaea mexicana]KAI9497057.1 hypothetical protein BDB00DRAFT_868895 [Zychaea mexicana]
MVAMNLYNYDLEITQINGYTFETPKLLEGVDNVAIAYGQRDRLPVVAKLSYHALRLEREYHMVKRLYRHADAKQLLCQPLEKLSLPNGLIALIFADYGTNKLDAYQPTTTQSTSITASTTNDDEQAPPLGIGTFLDFAIQCCNCLELIHKQQIVHGEIKLNAFLWPEKETAKIWNFGAGARSLENNLTSEGWRKTVQRNGANNFWQMLIYMSPEQTGRTTFQPDHRTDLYSLGITFFVVLTQSMPFAYNSPMEIVHSVLNRRIPTLHQVRTDVPVAISSIVEKLTNKSPDERYSSAHGLREDLKECQRHWKGEKEIQSFALGRNDIASVFTLPNACFGREKEIEQISTIIRRTAYTYGHVVPRRSRLDSSTVDSLLTPLEDADKNRLSLFKRLSNSNKRTSNLFKRRTETISISGSAGVGKSTLLRQIQQVARAYGYIATAKFDRRNPMPYGCILRCMSIFFKQILTEVPSEVDRFANMLKEQLGPIAQLPILLLDNVPEIRTLLSEAKDTRLSAECDIGGSEIKMRFHSAFIEIFQVMVRYKFVTLFLEDLHQADDASIELLESLISARLNFLVIITYRRSELSESVNKLLQNENAAVTHVKLDNLEKDALMDLVRTPMHRNEEIDSVLLTPLVDFIYQKTRGNPFYVCQLLTTLEKKGLLYFTWEQQGRWEYNLQEIEKALLSEMGEKNQDIDVEFLVRRLKELPRDGRKFVKWASFIGNNFSFETVRHLMMDCENDTSSASELDSDNEFDNEEFSPLSASPRKEAPLEMKRKNDAINGLQSALQQGFIEAFSNDEFGFSHDRYSQAAMMLAKPEKRDKLHLKIASYFMDKPNVDTFWVADHLKAALHLIKAFDKRDKHRALLIQAGNKAYGSGAHNLAYSYYAGAQELLSQDPWTDGHDSSYQETLHLFTRLAEISWFMGYGVTPDLLNTIFKNAKSAIDRAAAYRIQHRYHFSRKEHQKKSSILLECLAELGIENVRLDLMDEELRRLHEETRSEVLALGLDKVSDLPVCESRLIRTRLSILEEVCLWAYWMNDTKAILSIGSRLVLMTLQHGTSPTTGVGFVYFGIAAMQLFKAYEFGQQIGAVGVSLCDKYGGNSESARARYLYGAFLSSWKHHYRDSLPLFRQSLKQSLLGGDRIYATFSHLHIVMGMLLCGENMSDTLREAKMCLDEVTRWNEFGTSILVTTIIRMVLALQGKTFLTEDKIFDDKDFEEAPFVAEMYEQNPDSGLPMFWYYALKLIVLVIYGYDEAAFKIGHEYAQLADMQPSHRHTHLMLFFHCLAMIRLVRSGKGDRDALLKQIEKHHDTLQEFAKHSPQNLQMFVSLIDAELASLTPDMRRTEQLYDLAIDQAKSGQWGLETSIMYELAGEYYIRCGARHVGALLIDKAVAGYRHQGCYGKAIQLEQLHASSQKTSDTICRHMEVQTETHVVSPRRDSFGDISLSEPYSVDVSTSAQASPEETLLTLDVVDLASILKSSQIISSEMNFELLMEQLLGIILENSGAESGVIIIKENSSFLIMARGSQAEGCEILKSPKLLSEEATSMVSRVARYAIHTQESLLIPDIHEDPRFNDFAAAVKSVICVPITHKSAIVGCIYIEGAVGSLTARHEVVLRLLSQQIGISVTNALLFKSIQKVTYANVKMIENQKAALEEARKSKEAALRAMKLKADFLANMSHELRTPFSGFYGMISLLSETSLDAEQSDIVHTAKESCEMLLKIIDDLLNFSKLEAGKVVPDLGPLAVEELIADTFEILSSLAARKGLELAYIVEPDVPETVTGDSSRLRQILTNLLGNAIKFTHEGGVVIKCCLDEELEDDHVRLKFEVIDTGIGINTVQQRNLFEPFSQVDGSTTRMYGGTGLGLSICLQLVRLMGGNIGVISQIDHGSNFWFSVVVRRVGKEAEEARPTPSLQLRQSSILMTTNQDATANMMHALLADLNLKRNTTDMQHAIAQALQERHEILLLDIPPMPNSYIAQQLQSVDDDPECDLHIILLYTPATEGHKVAAEATNSASDRRGRIVKMAKPARRAKLLRVLEQVLSQPRLTIQTTPIQQQQPTPMVTPMPTPVKAVPSQPTSKMAEFFTPDELEWFREKPVLIAEDNMVAQKLLRKQLEKMGFVVESANNGEEAIQLWQQRPDNHFVIGFFDHHMPACDGVEATKKIREMEMANDERPTRLPIIALTADIQDSAREYAISAGMDGYLTKPLIPKDLAVTLRRLCPPLQSQQIQQSPSPPP